MRSINPTGVVTAVGAITSAALDTSLGQIRHRSNRSRRGLYDGRDIRSGNYVSFSNRKTPRKFRPNVFKKRVYSEILDEMIQFHVTAGALRSIDKAGGLDNYLMKTDHAEEGEGAAVRKRIKARIRHLAWLEREAVAAGTVDGLPAIEEESEDTKESI